MLNLCCFFFFFSSRRRHTRFKCDWSSDVCSSDLLWQAQELAIVQGVGYPKPNLSHFRSIEIWDTASDSDDYLEQGWLSQVFGRNPPPRPFAADGVVVGSAALGPLAGARRRAS